MSYSPEALSRAVAAVCPDIRARVDSTSVINEQHLWWELSCCILSSQVPYSLAIAAADVIDRDGSLRSKKMDIHSLEDHLYAILSSPLIVDGKMRSYRFPRARARHLAATHQTVFAEGGTLKDLLQKFRDATEARAWLVTHAAGLGPKQASMFLRNCGYTYELAVLDRHVLNYMFALGICSDDQTSISGLNKYGKHEVLLRDYAQKMNCPVGFLDWAIWIVMRVANTKQEALVI